MNNGLENHRAEIDVIDAKLLRLLNRRTKVTGEIGMLKQHAGVPYYDPDRERTILAGLCRINHGPMDEKAIMNIFGTIIRESRRITSQATVQNFQ